MGDRFSYTVKWSPLNCRYVCIYVWARDFEAGTMFFYLLMYLWLSQYAIGSHCHAFRSLFEQRSKYLTHIYHYIRNKLMKTLYKLKWEHFFFGSKIKPEVIYITQILQVKTALDDECVFWTLSRRVFNRDQIWQQCSNFGLIWISKLEQSKRNQEYSGAVKEPNISSDGSYIWVPLQVWGELEFK